MVCFIQIIVPFKDKGLSGKSEHIYTKYHRVLPPPPGQESAAVMILHGWFCMVY